MSRKTGKNFRGRIDTLTDSDETVRQYTWMAIRQHANQPSLNDEIDESDCWP